MTIEESPKHNRLNEVKEHAMELREFADPDWNGSQEDLEMLWDIRDALSRSIKKGEVVPSESAMAFELAEAYELPKQDAELLLAELDALPIENVDKDEEKVENAERPL
jgi:hypothetical protein